MRAKHAYVEMREVTQSYKLIIFYEISLITECRMKKCFKFEVDLLRLKNLNFQVRPTFIKI